MLDTGLIRPTIHGIQDHLHRSCCQYHFPIGLFDSKITQRTKAICLDSRMTSMSSEPSQDSINTTTLGNNEAVVKIQGEIRDGGASSLANFWMSGMSLDSLHHELNTLQNPDLSSVFFVFSNVADRAATFPLHSLLLLVTCQSIAYNLNTPVVTDLGLKSLLQSQYGDDFAPTLLHFHITLVGLHHSDDQPQEIIVQMER
mmetsp:Transcript_39750/g.89201  ORF Transcript_39750/g.89201 Transcript_39750/m.89201 type:complete len:200 (+) Transcript_39750:1044-1643(+)